MKQQRGAAILTAMLTVTLVATLSAAALWQQWRGIEIESAERARLQSAWVLQGALDWARLILSEDARGQNRDDHLGEPWAVPLQEARLSTFLATHPEQGTAGDALDDAFLSGQVIDLQSRLNMMNLIKDGKPHPPSVRAFARLFDALHLPDNELSAVVTHLQASIAAEPDPSAALVPRTLDQMAWMGLSAGSIAKLRPYATVLPERTPVNLNTAPALVLYACIDNTSMANAQRLVSMRAQSHFRSLEEAAKALGGVTPVLQDGEHSVGTRFFEIRGQLRLGDSTVQERSVVQRDGPRVKVLWKQRGASLETAFVQ